ALYQVGEARVKLAGNDRSGARLALDEAEKGLTPLLPKFESLAGTKPETITQLFELARGDLERDARLAQQDMERLASELKLIVESVNP
ncbi:MAG: hypothetical protein HY835_13595, partial [Anaerolineae bacterium]|nr:hypothetical protein [Anaerolineae bacterium]